MVKYTYTDSGSRLKFKKFVYSRRVQPVRAPITAKILKLESCDGNIPKRAALSWREAHQKKVWERAVQVGRVYGGLTGEIPISTTCLKIITAEDPTIVTESGAAIPAILPLESQARGKHFFSHFSPPPPPRSLFWTRACTAFLVRLYMSWEKLLLNLRCDYKYYV